MRPSEDCIQNAPLLQAMLGYAAQGRISFHMPGHQDGSSLPQPVRERLAEMDATELSATDDLNDPAGPAAAAMQAAAAAFRSGETLFVTGGSTTAIQAMVTAFCPRGSLIVMPRAVHRSVLNIAMLLGLQVAFLPAGATGSASGPEAAAAGNPAAAGEGDPFCPIRPPEPAAVRRTLRLHPDARAVLVTSPDYFGTCPDLHALASVAAEFGCPLLVDEAHGAHLGFAPDLLPPSALDSGASACVQSAHKTLPALTQGAYLHRNASAILAGGRPWPSHGHLRQCLSLYQTSSPSLMIGATLDYARALMEAAGQTAVADTLQRIDRFRAGLSPLYRCTGSERSLSERSLSERSLPARSGNPPEAGPVWRDPLRVVIDVLATGLTGFEIARRLAAQGIDVEMADIRRLVLIPGLFQAEQDLPALAAALNQIAAESPATKPADTDRAAAWEESGPAAAGADDVPAWARRIAWNRSLDQAFYRWLQMPPASVGGAAASPAHPDDSLPPLANPVSPLLAGLPVRWLRLSEAGGANTPTDCTPAVLFAAPAAGVDSSPVAPVAAVAPHAAEVADALVAADALVPYPPGIPLVWPGEVLDGARLAMLRLLLENGFCVHGIVMERENPGIRILA